MLENFLDDLYGNLQGANFEKVSVSDVADNLDKILEEAQRDGLSLFRVTIQDSTYPSIYYFLGKSADDFSDQSELYKELFIADSDGYVLSDRCFVSFEEV